MILVALAIMRKVWRLSSRLERNLLVHGSEGLIVISSYGLAYTLTKSRRAKDDFAAAWTGEAKRRRAEETKDPRSRFGKTRESMQEK